MRTKINFEKSDVKKIYEDIEKVLNKVVGMEKKDSIIGKEVNTFFDRWQRSQTPKMRSSRKTFTLPYRSRTVQI